MPESARVARAFELLERLVDLSDEEIDDMCAIINGLAARARGISPALSGHEGCDSVGIVWPVPDSTTARLYVWPCRLELLLDGAMLYSEQVRAMHDSMIG